MPSNTCARCYIFIFSFLFSFFFIPFDSVGGYEQNCIFKKNGTSDLYNLFSLSQLWKVKIGNETDKLAVISLCGEAETPCGQGGVCIVEKKDGNSVNRSMGRIMQRPDIDSKSKRLTITFTGGDYCTSSLNYSTVIIFYCSEKIGEPHFQMLKNHTCQLVMNWGSSAACPVESTKLQESCKPSGSSGFNLWPLHHKQYYTVQTKEREFRINICDVVRDGTCNKTEDGSVCEMVPGTNKTISVLGLSAKQHFEFSEKGLVLTYKSKAKKVKTEIHFICNTSISHGEPKFKWTNNITLYVFEIETSLACLTRPVDCTVYDEAGSKFDLQSLSRSTRNWEVRDIRPGYEDVKYYINICRPLIPSPDFNCSEPYAAVCQVRTDRTHLSHSYNLGVLTSGPQLNAENQLKVYYSGGEPCKNGRKRSEITFICSKKERDPVFITETDDCVFIFEWATQAACPSKFSIGKDCMVREPSSNVLFDLNLLYNPHTDYSMTTDTGESYHINICKPLLKPCNGKRNISVCLESNGTEIAIGELATSPIYEGGRVNFMLHGDGCKAGQNSSTVYIIFMCHHQFVSNGQGPELFPRADDCIFYFVWQTNVSCPPFQEYPCKATDDDGHEYDLSPLSDPSGNYVVQHKTPNGIVTFLMNLCRSIVHSHDAPCPPDSGICLHNLTEPDQRKNYISLGNVVTRKDNKAVPNKLMYKNDHLQITYSEGYLCEDVKATTSLYISSTIYFYCDIDDKNSGPTFRGESECHYEFEWGTKYACLPNSHGGSTQKEKLENCSAINPATKTRFDLSTLSNKDYSVSTANGKKFTLAVCGSSKECGEGIGACMKTEGTTKSVGLANSSLQFNPPSLLFLNYINGSECAPGIKITTLIEFVCEEDPGKFGPFYVDTTSSCTYIFYWLTDIVCEAKSSCVANNNTVEISLSPLISTTKNYQVTANGSDFFINVCRPLLPQEGLSCSGGSSACKATADPNGRWSREQSLGFSDSDPVIVDGGVSLKYYSGSVCSEKGSKFSSEILFSCDPMSDIGSPELQTSTDCQYQFLWRTSVVCPDYITAVDSSSYNLYNTQRHQIFDLEPLCKGKGHIVGNYTLMCTNTQLSVFWHYGNQNISYGRLQNMIFSYAENVTKLLFSGGDSCFSDGENSIPYDAEMRLKCVPEVEIGSPVILFTTNCSVVFVWGNKVGCGCTVVTEDKKKNASSASHSHVSTAGVVVGILLTIIVCLVLIYFRKADNRTWCRNRVYNLLNKRHHGNFHYSREEWDDT